MDHHFWDTLAQHYPSFNHPQMQEDVQFILQCALQFGIVFNEKHLLDIGCGTGTIAIPLAKLGANVDAMDISSNMLARLIEDSVNANLTHSITPIQSTWDTFKTTTSYDIVLGSMTPALRSQEAIEKFFRTTNRWGIFVGWGGYKRNDFLQALLKIHAQPYTMPSNRAQSTYALTQAKGYRSTLTFFETSWEKYYTRDEALEYALAHLKQLKIKANSTSIQNMIDGWSCWNGDALTIRTEAEKGVVVFEV